MYDVFLNIHFKNVIQEETHPSQTLNNKNGKGGERFSQKRFIGGKHARVYLYAFQKRYIRKDLGYGCAFIRENAALWL